jgi:hypothetical protein
MPKAAVQSEPTERQKRKGRSPSYPGVGLQKALELAATIRQREGRNAAPINAVLGHWSYKPKSGAGLVAVAALKKFGLVTDAGSGDRRTVQLSDLAYRILVDEREASPEKQQLVKQAALTPVIHRTVWYKYAGNLPSDQTLSYFLKTEKGFTDVAVKEFIPQFRATVAFAQLSISDRVSSEGENEDQDDDNGDDLDMLSRIEPEGPKGGVAKSAIQGGQEVVLWRQGGNIGPGLLFDLRLIGGAGRKIRPSEYERLAAYVKLHLDSIRDELEIAEASE